LPFNAFASWLLFRKRGYNYAEHLVANTFLIGHLAFLGLFIVPVFYLLPSSETFGIFNMVFSLSVSAFFYSFAYKQWFKDPWGESIARGVITALLGITMMLVGLFLLGIVVAICAILIKKFLLISLVH